MPSAWNLGGGAKSLPPFLLFKMGGLRGAEFKILHILSTSNEYSRFTNPLPAVIIERPQQKYHRFWMKMKRRRNIHVWTLKMVNN